MDWISTLETLRDALVIDTLLVGQGVPTTRAELDHMITLFGDPVLVPVLC